MQRVFDPEPVTEWHDIQALAKTAFGSLPVAGYLLLRVKDPACARQWLGSARPASIAHGRLNEAMQIALTAEGMAALGVETSVLAQFGPEFRQGMSGDPSRSRRLGDIAVNAPEHWLWGGAEATMPHILVMLFATVERLPTLHSETIAAISDGFDVLGWEVSAVQNGLEPFGFLDGISQPVVDWQAQRRPGSDADYTHLLASGEVLLGYSNEYNCLTDRPLLPAARAPDLPRARDASDLADLGRNGSYLVYRRLAQDVTGFWQWLASVTADGDAHGALAVAEAMVGRSIDGLPLAGLAAREIPGGEPHDLNDFSFAGDGSGLVCPIGAHIRRANPRNADLPRRTNGIVDRLAVTLGLRGEPLVDAVSSTRFHRLLRRGRRYGAMLPPEQAMQPGAADPQAGLHFIALQASISRQFEFIQSAWVNSAKFAGLSGESDPLLGNRCPFPGSNATDGFTRPGSTNQTALPQFVRVTAGAYFFLPGLAALRFIAAA